MLKFFKSKTLSKNDLAICSEIAKKTRIDTKKVRNLMVQWQQLTNKTNYISSPEELLSVFQKVDYFVILKNQAKNEMRLTNVIANNKDFQLSIARSVYAFYDSDGDGKISFEEFAFGFLVHSTGDPLEKADLMFDLMDIDKSGSLSKDEVMRAVKQGIAIHKAVTTVTMQEIIAGLVLAEVVPALNLKQRGFKPTEAEAVRKIIRNRLNKIVEKVFDESFKDDHSLFLTEQIFEIGDCDRNGILSKSEYVKYATDPEMQLEYVKRLGNLKIVPQVEDVFTDTDLEKLVEEIANDIQQHFGKNE